LKWFFLSLLFLIAAVYVFIQTPFGQNWIARQVVKRLSHDLKTKVSIAHVDFSLFNRMHLQGVLVEDQKGDTLMFAGDMKVRITDWFFVKKEADLKYVGLENALIKFQRTDSVWSQQFLFDYFSSPSTGTSKKKAGILFHLKEVEMKNVTFVQKDAWLGQDLVAHVDGLSLKANQLSLSGNEFIIDDLLLNRPDISILNYPRLKPHRSPLNLINEDLPDSAGSGASQAILRVGHVKITDGTFRSDKQNAPISSIPFDGQHLLFTAINGEWMNTSYTGNTITATMKLSAKEKSGLVVRNLSSNVKMTPKEMIFDSLDLVTNRSTIHRYFSMSYNDINDMADFIHKVQMSADFQDSYIDTDDLAFFAPATRTWKRKISLRGNVRGTVDAIVGKNMLVEAGGSTLLNGDLSLTGLPDINQTFIDLRANDFRTTYGDAITFVPALRQVRQLNLASLHYVDFTGNFTGFVRDFVTFGTIRTNLGTVKSDVNMKFPAGKDPIYSGNISTANFQLGSLLGNKYIGAVAMNAKVRGRGFTTGTLNTVVDAKVDYLDYDHYRYHNIVVNGQLIQQLFNGYASIDDPNAALTLNGTIDFNNKPPRFNLVADVAHADLRSLGLTADSVTFRGLANLDFTSDNIDNFLGTARISSAELIRNGKRLPFDSLLVESFYVNGGKQFVVESNEFSARISGNYSLKELPSSFTYLLNKYYPAYVSAPTKRPQHQDINFDIYTYSVDDFTQLIDPKLSAFSNAHLQGRLRLDSNILQLTADVPQLRYGNLNFNDIRINANSNGDSLVVDGQANNIRINDSLSVPQALFHVNAHNDSSRISIVTGARSIEKANLNALVLTYNDGFKIEFDQSNFTINGKTWTIDESGELVLRKKTLSSGLLVLTESDQRILVKTQPSPTGHWNDVKVEMTKVNIGDIAPYFIPQNRVEGLLSGDILVEDPTGNMKITSDDIHTQFLRLDDDSLGEVKTTLRYESSTGQLRIKGNTVNPENYLAFDANLFVNGGEESKKNLITLNAEHFQINVLQRFLGSIFTEMRGYLTGNIRVSGPFDNINVTGKGRLMNAGVRVKLTQCFYWVHDTDITLDSTEINLDGIVLTDSVTGNPIYLTGGIEHQNFHNMFYNLDISTRKPGTTDEDNNRPVQLLNTTAKDSKEFYGNVKGTASLSLAGPQSDMFLKIDAVASTTDSSNVTLPPSSGRENGIADFLLERQYGREMTVRDMRANANNVTYDIDLTVNKTPIPMVSVRVVLDDLTGDEIKGKGFGNLNIHSGTFEPLALRGRFNIVEGSYLFTFQSFFKKPFQLRTEHDNFIEWNGNPYNANINFEAVYRAERVSFAPLAPLIGDQKTSSNGVNSGAANARGDVYVVASLKDSLFKPTISFSLDFPSTSIAVTDPTLGLIFQQMQKDPNEITRQATYLIVFNSFAPSNLTSDASYSVGQLGLTTISGILLNVVNDQINKLLGNLLKNDKYNISLNTTIYNRNVIGSSNGSFDLAGNINLTVGRAFFNNRFRITTGVGYDAPITSNTLSQNFSQQLLPDVTLEWLINPSGTVRASFFYRENTDYLSTATTGGKDRRIGANLSYRKDFDSFLDIFRKRKKAPKSPKTRPSDQEGIPVTSPTTTGQ
jgi:hypothetical protein